MESINQSYENNINHPQIYKNKDLEFIW